MPHFGLMEEKKLGAVAGPFQRSRLHLRSARRRLREGETAAGIVTLYDAFSAAMESYAASERAAHLDVRPDEDVKRDRDLYRVLVRSRVISNDIDFEAFDRLTEEALDRELPGFDHRPLLQKVESVLTQLEVLPFDEAGLPPEHAEQFLSGSASRKS